MPDTCLVLSVIHSLATMKWEKQKMENNINNLICDWCGEVMLQGDAVVRSLTGANYVDNYNVCPRCAEHGGEVEKQVPQVL